MRRGDVVLDIARIAGPDGFVTGVDFDRQVVALARQDARDSGAGNVEYHVADVRVFEGGPFDLKITADRRAFSPDIRRHSA